MERSFAERYGDLTRWHWWFRGRERVLEALLARELKRARPRRVLSVGAGPRESLAWLRTVAGEGGFVAGTDADPSGALLATRATVDAPPFAIAAADAPPFAQGAFDLVLALDVLEHLDDDAAALRACRDLVAPGGLLLVTAPAGPSLWGRQDVVSGHRRRYTRRTLAAAFERAGLGRPSRLAYFNVLLHPPIAAVRWTRRLLRRPAYGSDFDGSVPGVLNDVLAAIFAAERHLVGRVPFPFGVSLAATLRC